MRESESFKIPVMTHQAAKYDQNQHIQHSDMIHMHIRLRPPCLQLLLIQFADILFKLNMPVP